MKKVKVFFKIIGKVLFFIGTVFLVLFGGLSALLSASVRWMFETWPNLSMQELMFQLQSPIEGTSKDMIDNYIESCVPVTVLMIFMIVIILISCRKRKKVYLAMTAVVLLTSGIIIVSDIHRVYARLEVKEYVVNRNTNSGFIDSNYVDPAETEISFPEQKRNLIYIFLESMETTYASKENGGAYDENYIPELTQIAMENEDFSGVEQELNGANVLNYATWTVAGLFAQTSGLHLYLPIDGNSMDTQESFLPDLTALGDILEDQGYNQTILFGSDSNYAGRSLYFSDHGNYDIKDYYYYRDIGKFPEDYAVWWGFEDQKLFEYAKEELLSLASQEEPFNFTMLTADTHFEDGYVCGLCGAEYGDNTYANVLACSSCQVSEFVSWIQQQHFYENTTIVLSGDHLTMDSDFCENIDDSYNRKVYTTYINSAVEPQNSEQKREYSTFDNFPTTLASLGVQIEGDRLGLGTNLFSEQETLVELYSVDEVNSELMKKSDLMDRLAEGIDENNTELMIREGRIPTAEATALPYDFRTGLLQVVINDFQNTENGIAMITAAVWTKEDQSDLQWVQAELQEDGNYLANISVPNFDYITGEYYIDIYLVDDLGDQYLASSTVGYVQ